MSARHPVKTNSEPARHLDAGKGVRGRDQGLARYAVGEDGGAPQTVAIDNGDSGSEMGSDQRRLISSGAAAKDND